MNKLVFLSGLTLSLYCFITLSLAHAQQSPNLYLKSSSNTITIYFSSDEPISTLAFKLHLPPHTSATDPISSLPNDWLIPFSKVTNSKSDSFIEFAAVNIGAPISEGQIATFTYTPTPLTPNPAEFKFNVQDTAMFSKQNPTQNLSVYTTPALSITPPKTNVLAKVLYYLASLFRAN